MFVPISIPRSYGVVNHQVVYSDTVLNIKAIGKELIVTKLDVESFDLQECLNAIFEANPDVVFHTVQYSYKNKQVIFYTNNKIAIKEWKKLFHTELEGIPNSLNIVERVEKVLNGEDDLNDEYISVYDVWCIYYRLKTEIETKRKSIASRINGKLKLISFNDFCCLHDFNYAKNEVSITIMSTCNAEKNFVFAKRQGDLYIKKTKGWGWNDSEIFSLIGAEINEWYEYCYALNYVENERANKVLGVNCDFYVDVSISFFYIYDDMAWYRSQFKIRGFNSAENFECECNSGTVQELLKSRKKEFTKKVFVKIPDCPMWMQEQLYSIRKKQIEELKKELKQKEELERKRQNKIMRKEKICMFFKSLLRLQ